MALKWRTALPRTRSAASLYAALSYRRFTVCQFKLLNRMRKQEIHRGLTGVRAVVSLVIGHGVVGESLVKPQGRLDPYRGVVLLGDSHSHVAHLEKKRVFQIVGVAAAGFKLKGYFQQGRQRIPLILRKWREEVTFDTLEHGLLVRHARAGDAEAGAILPLRGERQTQQTEKNGLHHDSAIRPRNGAIRW